MYDVSIKTADDMPLAALEQIGDYADGSAGFQKLATILTMGNHWPNTRGMVGVYHDDPSTTPTEKLRSHKGVVWAGGDVPSGLEPMVLKGGRYAVLHLEGPYSDLAAAYQHLYGPWLADMQERLRDDPAFEFYHNDPSDTAPADLRTDIYMPLAD